MSSPFKTILSYGCPDTRTNEVGLFATPSRSINGVPAGDASRGHCARQIAETAATIAAYRRSTVVTPPPPSPTPPTSEFAILCTLDIIFRARL
jgi:hypothetical protein